MKIILQIFTLILLCNFAYAAKTDSIAIKNIELKIEQLDNQLKEVRRDELNYRIEKDILKETYSNNYSQISLIITIVLGIIALLGYLGIKDINVIKKEYTSELARLRTLQTELEGKIKDFGETKVKYDKEITDIIKQNDEQNNKIKILELKEKINKLFHEKQYSSALEFCVVALEIAPDDVVLLMHKAGIFTRTKNYPEAIKTYLRILEINPNFESAISNLGETYLFNNQNDECERIVTANKQLFNDKASGKVLELFDLIKLHNKSLTKDLLEKTKQMIDVKDLEVKTKRIEGWVLQDALTFVADNYRTSIDSQILGIFLLYWDGQLNGKIALERLNEIKI